MSAKNPSEEEPKANSAPVMPEAKVSDQPASGKFEVRPKLSKSGEVDWGHGKKIYVRTLESRVSGISGYSGYSPLTAITPPPLPLRVLSQDPEAQKLREEIVGLQAKVAKLAHQIQTEKADKAQAEARSKTLEETVGKLKRKQELDFLISRVAPEAENAILTRNALADKFLDEKRVQDAFVVSIDMRRSTDLMVKARSPAHFAAFMTELCSELAEAIKQEYGVFDKFTGDGVLAFFPEFFSGKDAGYHALMMGESALLIFSECCLRHRSSFTAVLRDVHVTVGIDYGPVHLVQVAGGLTVVGVAVVYACRLATGPAGHIFLNQSAYDEISKLYGNLCLISETTIESKHEGGTVCYDLKRNKQPFTAATPPWLGDPADVQSKDQKSVPAAKGKQ